MFDPSQKLVWHPATTRAYRAMQDLRVLAEMILADPFPPYSVDVVGSRLQSLSEYVAVCINDGDRTHTAELFIVREHRRGCTPISFEGIPDSTCFHELVRYLSIAILKDTLDTIGDYSEASRRIRRICEEIKDRAKELTSQLEIEAAFIAITPADARRVVEQESSASAPPAKKKRGRKRLATTQAAVEIVLRENDRYYQDHQWKALCDQLRERGYLPENFEPDTLRKAVEREEVRREKERHCKADKTTVK